MSVFEILYVVLILMITTLFLLNSIRLFSSSGIEPYVLKARVFSELKKLRRSKGFYRLTLNSNGVFVVRGDGSRYRLDPGVEISFINTGRIVYTSGRISEAGSVYGEGWSVRFQPVTGLMSVEVK